MQAKTKPDIDIPLLVTIVAVTAIFLLVTTIGVDAWYRTTEAAVVEQKWDESPNQWLADLRAEERANLNITHRINRNHWHVPVSEAMRILAEKNGKLSD